MDAIDIQPITTERAWGQLHDEWDPLVQRATSRTIFLTREWLAPWWRHYRKRVKGRGLHILTARRDGRLVGLAPFYWQRVSAYGLGRMRQLRWLGDGSGDSEYLDFIVEPGLERAVLSSFWEHLSKEPWSLLNLNLVPSNSPNLTIIRELAEQSGHLVREETFPCSSLELPDEWEDYLDGLKSRFRTRVRSLLRRLPDEHGVVFDQCSDPDRLGTELESLFELHQERWRSVGEPGSFALPERRAFYHDMARAFLDRGWLRLYSLHLNGDALAYEYSFEFDGSVYYLQHAFDINRPELSAGTAIKAFILKSCIERGAKEYDFLGGEARHKKRWGARTKYCVHLTVARPSLRARWRLALPRRLDQLRDRGRALTPTPILRAKRGLQDYWKKLRYR